MKKGQRIPLFQAVAASYADTFYLSSKNINLDTLFYTASQRIEK